MSSKVQNNNNLDKTSDGKLDIEDTSGSLGFSQSRKSKKKKKLGLFSFRSKKSKTVSLRKDNLTKDQSDSVSICSEISTIEDGAYSSSVITTTTHTEKHIAKLESSQHIVVNHTLNTDKTEIVVEEASGNNSIEKSDELDSEAIVITTTEDENTITIVTPVTEDDEQTEISNLSQRPLDTEDRATDSQSQQGSRESETNQTAVQQKTTINNESSSKSEQNSTPEDSPERPSSIYLNANPGGGGERSSFRKSLARRKQKIFAENRSSSTDLSSYPVSPVKSSKTKSKKVKMSNYAGATHQLKVRLLSGQNLAARDSTGLSDPYVKFKFGGRTVFKSRIIKENLNPKWDEEFTIPARSSDVIAVRVYDKDFVTDDFMGSSSFDLQTLAEDEETELSLDLEDEGATVPEELGRIHIAVTLTPLADEIVGSCNDTGHLSPEDFADNMSVTSWKASSFSRSDSNASDISRRTTISEMRFRKMKVPVGTATLQLVSGTGLPARDSNGFSDPYVKLQMGKQRHRSKVCYKTLDPVWKEEFVFQLTSRESLDREPTVIEMTVWDRDSYRKDDFIGRCELDLGSLEYDKTHSFNLNLIDAPGSLMLLVTLQSCLPSDMYNNNNELVHLKDKFNLFSTFSEVSNIGFVKVKVIRANGCRAADIGGKSDPFCVVELCNARAQTHTCYKTLDPVWNKTVSFPIKDIHDVLDFTVFDEDKDENDFLGRLAIPLLRAKDGVEKTYVLKDRKLLARSKGTITIQVSLIFNPARAAIRTFSPREPKLMEQDPRFKRQLLLRNFHRVWNCLQAVLQTAEFINSCFTWENSVRSATAFIVYLLLVWNVELYMLPILLLLLLLKNYFAVVIQKTKVDRRVSSNPDASFHDDDDMDDDAEDGSNKVSFLQRLKAIEEVLLKVQNILDWIACLLERIHNTFTWSVPFLSTLAIIVLSVVVVILYFVPIRTIAILWGINKFTKRLRKPNYIPNNELLDFLSRIPSEVELDEFQELSALQGSPKNSKKRK